MQLSGRILAAVKQSITVFLQPARVQVSQGGESRYADTNWRGPAVRWWCEEVDGGDVVVMVVMW